MRSPLPALLDGSQPLQHAELAALLRERARMAAEWFVPIQQADGSFPYTYDPVSDRYDVGVYNEVRHAGVTYALFQACALFDDPALRACARNAAQWIVHSSVSTPAGGAAYLYEGRCKLGGLALAIVALLEGRNALGETGWDEAIAALGQFLLGLELPNEPGRFFQSFEAATDDKLLTPDSNYYPGEALLALVGLHGAFPGGPWLAAAQRAATYLIRVKDGDQIRAGRVPREDHWLTIALSALYRFDPNPDYATIVFLQAERMAGSQYQADDPEPWRIGAGRRRPTPSFPSTATQAEALNAAWELASRLDDAETEERYSLAALKAARFLMRVQYTEHGDGVIRFPRPERTAGGWAQDIDRARIRIDFVQHGLSALIGAARLLELERPVAQAHMEPWSPDLRLVGRHNAWSTEAVVSMTLRVPPMLGNGDFDIGIVLERVRQELDRLPGHPHGGWAGESAIDSSQSHPVAVGELIGWAAVAMQRCLGDAVSFSTSDPGSNVDELQITFGFRYGEVGLAAAALAARLVAHAVESPAKPFDFLVEFQRTVAKAHPSRVCRPDVWAVLKAAKQREIPVRSLDLPRQMVSLGSGAYGRRFWSLSTSGTSQHGVKIARDKLLASQILRSAGLPVPRGTLVTSSAQALSAAAELGYPVVLKPNLGSQGSDVFVEIRDEAELTRICQHAFGGRSNGEWLVEAFVPGSEHRVLVIDGKVVAVNLRMPPEVTGDGVSTVEQLIAELNADPRRSFQKGFALKPVVPGAQHLATLRRQDLTLDSVPDTGRVVRLTSVSNASAGGSTRDVTDSIHADNARIACMAAAAVGLDIAGVDLVVPDIGRSFRETGGAIVEINSNPGMIDHLQPGAGPPRDVGGAIVDLLYPAGQPVRARIVVVLESADSAATCRRLAQPLAEAGWTVGVASRDGVALGGMTLGRDAPGHPDGLEMLLAHPAVEIAIVEIGVDAIAEYGLGVDACDAIVVPESQIEMNQSGSRSVDTVLGGALDRVGDRAPDAALAAIDRALQMLKSHDGSTAAQLLRRS
jgi:D-alanine-D-alanine ligase-like ATP-grasp enzyme